MKITVRNTSSVELLLQLALTEHLEINVKPIVVSTSLLYDTTYAYEVEIDEVKENEKRNDKF